MVNQTATKPNKLNFMQVNEDVVLLKENLVIIILRKTFEKLCTSRIDIFLHYP